MADSEEVIEIGMETVGRVAGEICVELLRQSHELEYVDSEGNPLETSLDSLAMNAHRLAIICCTGRIPR